MANSHQRESNIVEENVYNIVIMTNCYKYDSLVDYTHRCKFVEKMEKSMVVGLAQLARLEVRRDQLSAADLLDCFFFGL